MKQKQNNKKSSKNIAKSSGLWFYGFHPINAAILNKNRKILEIRTSNEVLQKLPTQEIKNQNIIVNIFSKEDITKMMPPSTLHQGVIAKVEPLPFLDIEDVIENNGNQKSIIIILDNVSDPHNVGAILRTAALFGATALVVTDKNAPAENGTLAKTASGALEKTPYIRAVNIKRTIDTLKKNGYWCIGFDGTAIDTLDKYKPSMKTAIIMGAEGDGMRRLTKESCDTLLRIETFCSDENLDSLNVSVASGIAIYQIINSMK